MLTETMTTLLNNQLINEFDNPHTYQQMAAWSEIKGFRNARTFFLGRAQEERSHMQGIFDYMLLMNAMPILKKVEVIKTDYKKFEDLFTESQRLEQSTTKKIHAIAKEAIAKDDFSTFTFIQSYIAEQRLEEDMFRTILDQFNILKDDANKDFFVDQKLPSVSIESSSAT